MIRPKESRKKEYYKWLEETIKKIESKLPVHVYGATGYLIAHYWVNKKEGYDYPEPCHTHVDIFEILMGEEL